MPAVSLYFKQKLKNFFLERLVVILNFFNLLCTLEMSLHTIAKAVIGPNLSRIKALYH